MRIIATSLLGLFCLPLAAQQQQINESQVKNLVSDLASKSPLASPTFTGTVTVPNLTVTGSCTGCSTGSGFPIILGSTSIASGSTTTSISGLTLVSPALTGTPTAPTATTGTNTTQVATTAYAMAAVANPVTPVTLQSSAITAKSLIVKGTNSTTINYVQGNGSCSITTASATLTCTLTSVTAGDFLYISFGAIIPCGTSVSSVADGVDTWSPLNVQTNNDGFGDCDIQAAYGAPNVHSGTHNVTITLSATANPGLLAQLAEYSGVATASPLDVATGTSSFDTPPVTIGPLTTTATGDLLLSTLFIRHVDAGQNASASGYTARMSLINTSSGGSLYTADKTAGVAGNYSAAWSGSWNSFRSLNMGILVALKGVPTLQIADLVQNEKYDGTVFSGLTAGGMEYGGHPIKTVAAAYTAAVGDHTLLVNGTFTITLPTTLAAGYELVVKEIAAASTATVSSTVNIDGATSQSISTQYGDMRLQWDGTQWWTH